LAALLVLLAQLPGVLDRHSPARAVQVDNGECALCLFAFHTPAQPASGPALAGPHFEIYCIAPSKPQSGPWRALTSPFSRAPPYSA
jgi:hypothetical protein